MVMQFGAPFASAIVSIFWVDVLGLADTSVREIPSPLSTALATSCSFD